MPGIEVVKMSGIWIGHTALAGAFVIIAAVFLWFFLSSKTRFIFKLILIPIVLWYGLALYFAVPNLAGWPTKQEIPEGSIVFAMLINEPVAIYILALPELTEENDSLLKKTDPRQTFDFGGENQPRFYEIAYSKELHRQVVEARKRRAQNKGIIRWFKNGGARQKGGGGDQQGDAYQQGIPDTAGPFEILNPRFFMPKGRSEPE